MARREAEEVAALGRNVIDILYDTASCLRYYCTRTGNWMRVS